MQTLIPLIVYLGLASGTHLTLVPYAYLVDPLPVYHQSQNTRTGEHAYSYSGGPSAKEEVKGLDGVTRGSYSYIDANGLLQSVFYVADEAGFRVAATNLPTSNDIPSEPEEVVLAKVTHQEALDKASSSRKKRSLEDPTPKEQDTSSEVPEKNKEEAKIDQVQSESSIVPVSSVSHQSRVDIHRNLRLEPLETGKVLEIPLSPVYTPAIPDAVAIPVATSHQSRVQIHDNVRLAVPEVKDAVKIEPVVAVQSPVVVPAIDRYQSGIPIVETVEPPYQEARIQFHKSLGIEGPNPKDAVKIEPEPVTIVEEPVISSARSSPILAKEVVAIPSIPAVPSVPQIITAYSSQSRSQIHQNSKLKLEAIPGSVQVEAAPVLSYVQPIPTISALIGSIPIAQSSQYQSQIRFNQKLEPVNLAVQTSA